MKRNSLKHILGWVCAVVAVGLSPLMAAGSLSAQTVSFIARKDFTAGIEPSAVAVGDFNGDGRLDLGAQRRKRDASSPWGAAPRRDEQLVLGPPLPLA